MSDVDLAGATWRASSFSANGNECVEVAMLGEVIAVRDSKNRGGPVLCFTPGEWRAFVAGAQDGEFDLG